MSELTGKWLWIASVFCCTFNCCDHILAQTSNSAGFRPKFGQRADSASNAATQNQSGSDARQTNQNLRLAANSSSDSGEITRVTKTANVLPSSAGQIWREYDIRPYTGNISTTTQPEKAIIEWVLRETGHEMWFQAPLGILNASKDTLRVYHTREVHDRIQPIVDRFVKSRGAVQKVGVKLVTINNPDWRTSAVRMMQPIDVQRAGVEGWLISKENGAVLYNNLKRRNDFQQHQAGDVSMHDGQQISISRRRPIPFVQSVRWKNDPLAPFEPVTKTINEGYSLDFSLLTSLDGQTIESIVQCDVDQVEKLRNVQVDVPLPNGTNQALDLKVPQMVSWRLHERFRWPSDKVLILSCGVVAAPSNSSGGFLQLPSFLDQNRGRADAIMFIEYKGRQPNR